ncbi:hypothetical protein E3O25_00510 [Cryobacterium sp. TMT1-3]|uniref:Uncharacterized protein n=1 Tax=Cryobacterium luteum TaxID=1424661 RepID=A0A1H8KY19_9MICO|nr:MULTISPECIES: hypothetical protein [Cryobacterium]TFB83221.1 hypothetical protein E3O10_16990 [Cryobacterium luteum]TFC31607.1 hypothetical protein E3O25_00510 [Cryobacterium sp. TMT1-3]SEN97773.1 hypothetical protein SAMN05216281_12236 [Cryobacterium luteum]
MRARIAASVVLAAGILLGTSACGFFAPQATLIQYNASDGVSGDVGDIHIRNALLLSADGELANLVVSVVNPTDTLQSLRVQYESSTGKVSQDVPVEANTTVTFGTDGAASVVLENMDSQPGSLFPVYFQYGEETGVELLLPVLAGTQDEYSSLLPTIAPTETPSETPTPTATPAA